MGGISRRAKYIGRLAQVQEPVLQVSAGADFFRQRISHGSAVPAPGATDYEKEAALVLAKAAARLKVDAQNIAAVDFRGGRDFLERLPDAVKQYNGLNLISSNLFDQATGQPLFETKRIATVAGVRFGVFGVSRAGSQIPAGVEARDPRAIAQEMIEELRTHDKADLVIGLLDLPAEDCRRLAAELPGMDIAVVSGDAQYFWKPEIVGGTLLAGAGSGGKYLGQIAVTYQPDRAGAGSGEHELRKLQDELEGLNKELGKAEHDLSTRPKTQARYAELKARREKVESELGKIALRFEYNYVLVPLDATMPEDGEVRSWVIGLERLKDTR